MTADAIQFFRAWMQAPLRVASVTPSSPALASLIVSETNALTGPVIELGPGTGVFTRALLARGVAERDLILVEKGPEFAALLRARFPQASVLCLDATALSRTALAIRGPAGAVISGLPLLSMKPRTVYAILAGAFAHLGDRGAFYQFTYGPRCPVPGVVLGRLGLKASRIGHTYRNFPPATVYRFSRRPVSTVSVVATAAGRPNGGEILHRP